MRHMWLGLLMLCLVPLALAQPSFERCTERGAYEGDGVNPRVIVLDRVYAEAELMVGEVDRHARQYDVRYVEILLNTDRFTPIHTANVLGHRYLICVRE